ncbi:hypothetical protein BDR03DRAFT_967006 [Suillus americanus]|nr:hypothetical protein BDR03DRAFT_967006 [Suillus americanus]
MYSGTFATAIRVNLRPAATSATSGSWSGADLRKERCRCRNCMAPFEQRKLSSLGCVWCDCLRNGSCLRRWSVQECRVGYCESPYTEWLSVEVASTSSK